MTYLNKIKNTPDDSFALDSFGRQRVSNPQGIFDSQLTYDLVPLIYEQLVTGTNASIAHDATNGAALMTLSSSPSGSYAHMQSFEYMRYQPLKSQEVAITFNMVTGTVGVEKRAGYGDDDNGIFFVLNGGTPQVQIKSTTDAGNETVDQSNWNLDTLDGTGPSGITLDISKTQIFLIDFQALYVGRVRVGFDIDGVAVPVHEFLHANRIAHPYIRTANLPIRIGMTASQTASSTMYFYCTAVASEGGQEDVTGYGFSAEGVVTAGNGTRTHALSLRPRETFNGQVNRTKFVLEGIEILVTGGQPVKWELVLGQALGGTTAFTSVNETYSAVEYNATGTVSGSPVIVIESGHVGASNQFKGTVSPKITNRYPITLDANGSVRSLGTLSLLVTGLGGTSATYAVMNWREVR